jgi:plastocyanin
MRKVIATCLVAFVCQACSKSSPESTAPPPGQDLLKPSASAATGVSVTGTATAAVDGVSPIVVLEPRDEREFPPQAETPVMDQANRIFSPALLFARTSEPVDFRNSDDELHNVNVKDDSSKEQMFNVAIPIGGTFEYTFKRPGLYNVHCDIHTMMAAIIVASSTPYATVADPSGHFSFDGVTPGPYTAIAYSGAATLKKPVDVGSANIDVAFQ